MDKKLNLRGSLDFSEIDLTAPNIVISEILKQLPEDTQGIIFGDIVEYDGHVVSYTKTIAPLAEALGTITKNSHIDIQNYLGMLGEENNKYECYLYSAGYDHYKYRMFFIQYGTATYPVQFTLEESIARSIGNNTSYIFKCYNREEVEELTFNILTSKKVLEIMQELIRIYQLKKTSTSDETIDESDEN